MNAKLASKSTANPSKLLDNDSPSELSAALFSSALDSGAMPASQQAVMSSAMPQIDLGLAVSAAATTTSVSKVYQHWADATGPTDLNGNWNNNILSAIKSEYHEGEVIPHVFVFQASNSTPLVPGQTYTFQITYNHYQPNSNAGGFTGLDTYLKSRDTDLSDDVNRSPFSGKDIAPDSYTNGADAMAGQFYTVGAAIKSVSAPVSASGGNDRVVTVSFTYTGDTTTSGYAEIYYGLTIARPGDIPPTSLGAHAWTGGSLQTTVQIGNAGATSIQLAPGAILWEPALTIDKQLVQVNDPDGALDSDGIVDQAGDVIHYNVVVHNSGNQGSK